MAVNTNPGRSAKLGGESSESGPLEVSTGAAPEGTPAALTDGASADHSGNSAPVDPALRSLQDLERRSRWLLNPRLWGAIAAIGLIGGGVAWWTMGRSRGVPLGIVAGQPSPTEDWSALTVVVQPEDVVQRIDASGTVQPVASVNLSPKLAGRLIALFVREGDRVERGQTIAKMDDSELQVQAARARASVARSRAALAELRAGNRSEDIAEARARVGRARADLTSAQARLTLAQERRRRNEYLFNEGAIGRDAFDATVQEERSALADRDRAAAAIREVEAGLERQEQGPREEAIARAMADVAEAQAALNLIEVQIADTVIRAPFSGIIAQKYAEPGSFVTPTTAASTGSGATSTSIASLANGLEVLAQVPEVDIGRITIGQPVEIQADAYPDRQFQGRVKTIAPTAVKERDVTSFYVRVDILTGLDVLRSGMNADLTFLGERLNQAIAIPAVAIVTIEGETGVLLTGPDGQPKFQPVVLGASLENRIQVLEGVRAGDRVFTELPPGKRLEDYSPRLNDQRRGRR